jgi:site-specific DNA-adenine methylase
MTKYGIPYMGSKGSICDKLIQIFPKADHFYDLFGGGFSVTHAMLKNRPHDYKHFHFNEIKQPVVDLIKDSIAGKYNYANFRPPWVSREEFHAKKTTCGYTACLWSFGGNQSEYLFGDIENYKKNNYNYVIFGDGWETENIKERRLQLKALPCKNPRLEPLERIERIQKLEGLSNVNFYSKDYREVEILPNSVVYCDIPYKGTGDYGREFDHAAFYDWAANHTEAVFFSEYNCDDPRFTVVFEIEKRSMLSPVKSNKTNIERVYSNGGWLR